MTTPKSYFDMTAAERGRVDQARADQHRYNASRFEPNGRRHDARRLREATSRSIVAAALCTMVLHTYPPVDPKAARQEIILATLPEDGRAPVEKTRGDERHDAEVERWHGELA